MSSAKNFDYRMWIGVLPAIYTLFTTTHRYLMLGELNKTCTLYFCSLVALAELPKKLVYACSTLPELRLSSSIPSLVEWKAKKSLFIHKTQENIYT